MTSLSDLPLREDLRGKAPYGAPMLDVPVRLNVNENTHPIPPGVQDAIADAIRLILPTINRYPDRESVSLRTALARYVSEREPQCPTLSANQIWAANGSNEVLQHVFQAFGGPGRSVLGFPPTYSMHPIIAEATGTRWIESARDPHYHLSPESVVDAITRHTPDLVFLCAPNNPTGTGLALETIEAAYGATNGIVLIDEAYIEFTPDAYRSALELLQGRPRLLISRTMSKAFAFAGARIGYLVADTAVIDAMRLVRLPYHLSALSQAAATVALEHAPVMLQMVDDIRGQRDRLLRELPELGYSVADSVANFVLFSGVTNPQATFQGLLDQGVLVRDVGIARSLRVTAGTEAETTAFLEALARLNR